MQRRTTVRAFTLVEAVIAIGVMGVLVVVATALLRGLPLSRDARSQSIAVSIATNELDRLRAGGYSALPASGTFSDALLADLPAGAARVDVAVYNDKTKRVDATVSWTDPAVGNQSIVMTTLITQSGGL